MQEIFLAKRLNLLCGSKQVSIDLNLYNTRYYELQDTFNKHQEDKGSMHDARYALDLLARATTARVHKFNDGKPRHIRLSSAILTSCGRGVSDLRDHIFGIQAIVRQDVQMKADYSLPTEEVYALFSSSIRKGYLGSDRRDVLSHLKSLARYMEVSPPNNGPKEWLKEMRFRSSHRLNKRQDG